jgi:hypothetical protein
MAREEPTDRPESIHACHKYGLLLILTTKGYLLSIDVATGNFINRQKVTDQVCVATAFNEHTDGLVTITGHSNMITIKVDEQEIIPFIDKSGMFISDGQQIIQKLVSTYNLQTTLEIYQKVLSPLIRSK